MRHPSPRRVHRLGRRRSRRGSPTQVPQRSRNVARRRNPPQHHRHPLRRCSSTAQDLLRSSQRSQHIETVAAQRHRRLSARRRGIRSCHPRCTPAPPLEYMRRLQHTKRPREADAVVSDGAQDACNGLSRAPPWKFLSPCGPCRWVIGAALGNTQQPSQVEEPILLHHIRQHRCPVLQTHLKDGASVCTSPYSPDRRPQDVQRQQFVRLPVAGELRRPQRGGPCRKGMGSGETTGHRWHLLP